MKIVRRPLTSAEKRALVSQQSFGYEVKDRRLYWDNSNCLPCEDQFEEDEAEDDENGWLEIPNGPYRVTVHVMDWFTLSDAERGAEADISHYVVRFEPVASLEEVPVPEELPWLVASKSWHESRVRQETNDPHNPSH